MASLPGTVPLTLFTNLFSNLVSRLSNFRSGAPPHGTGTGSTGTLATSGTPRSHQTADYMSIPTGRRPSYSPPLTYNSGRQSGSELPFVSSWNKNPTRKSRIQSLRSALSGSWGSPIQGSEKTVSFGLTESSPRADYHWMLRTSIKDSASLRNQQSRQHLIMELQHKANTLLGKLNDSLKEDRGKSEVNAENSQERRKSGPATRGGTDIEKRQGWLKELVDVVSQLSDLTTEDRNHDLPKSTSANSEAELDPSANLALPRSPFADSEGLMNGGTNAKPDDSGFTMHPNSEINDLGDIDSVPDGDDDRRD